MIVLHTKHFLNIQDSNVLGGSLGRMELKMIIKGNLEMVSVVKLQESCSGGGKNEPALVFKSCYTLQLPMKQNMSGLNFTLKSTMCLIMLVNSTF